MNEEIESRNITSDESQQTEKEEVISYDDILNKTELYENILTLPDEITILQYITSLRQTAKKYKLTGDFDRLVKPYKEKALKLLKEKEREQQNSMIFNDFPKWWNGNVINEDDFCTEYLWYHRLYCINGIFYDMDGEYTIPELSRDIYNRIKPYIEKNVADRTKRLIEAMKIKCYCPAPDVNENIIHVGNGTLVLDGNRFIFTDKKYFAINRLNVNYNSEPVYPKKWLKFLNELLEPTDILTLQEYMGYLLVPSTRAQKMIMISGSGGEGKSRIGKILFEIMGNKNAVSGSVSGLDNGASARFNKVKLVGRLCMIDDDMDMSALEKTDFLKQLITAEIPLEIEPKGQPAFQALLYTRIIAFGNAPISALYDRSYGFFRRQIILTAKPVPKSRINDKHLTEKLLAEKESIFIWCLQGLERLISNDFDFTLSEKAGQNIINSERESNNIIPFLESEHWFKYEPNGQILSKELYWAYESWCHLNNLDTLSKKTFSGFVKSHASDYGITYTEHAVNAENQRARGFIGIRYTYKSPSIMY